MGYRIKDNPSFYNVIPSEVRRSEAETNEVEESWWELPEIPRLHNSSLCTELLRSE